MSKKPRPVGRPRDVKVDEAILSATRDLLLEQGFDLMSIEAVAAQAGVGKGAIYRRWSDKTQLVVAAVGDLAQVPDVPDTGGLRDDLLGCARSFEQNSRTQAVLAGLMTAMGRHAELRDSARSVLGEPFTTLFRQIIERWIAAGAVDDTVDVDAISDVFPAMAFHRSTALGLSIDDQFVIRVIDQIVLRALGAAPTTTSRRRPESAGSHR